MSAPAATMEEEQRRELLTRARTIAIVGLSDKPERDSNIVARFLAAQGYRIIPINPAQPEILGRRSYPSLAAVPDSEPIDIVDVFRRSEEVPPIVSEAIARGVGAIWLQLGVRNPEALAIAQARGILTEEDRCLKIEHERLGVPARPPSR
ncbi:MAG: CoA-binding protein [Thermoplasmata archaeon]